MGNFFSETFALKSQDFDNVLKQKEVVFAQAKYQLLSMMIFFLLLSMTIGVVMQHCCIHTATIQLNFILINGSITARVISLSLFMIKVIFIILFRIKMKFQCKGNNNKKYII